MAEDDFRPRASNRWLAMQDSQMRDTASSSPPPPDAFTRYLDEPLVPRSAIESAGGVIAYWYANRELDPILSTFGCDYCSAPATSIDAERAFSEGRRQVNFMQHRMSHDTFKSLMALGSWTKAPFFDLNLAVDVLTKAVSRRKDFGESDNEEEDEEVITTGPFRTCTSRPSVPSANPGYSC
ncbi:hypothetical protein K523DRAFT_415276 [Schizophyllum commune Tattone D]|nr:hypothetical protein K523DRAFT_415276 [Schizophyllum commune Tattone D]